MNKYAAKCLNGDVTQHLGKPAQTNKADNPACLIENILYYKVGIKTFFSNRAHTVVMQLEKSSTED